MVAIDGPAGAGKSSVARAVADRLGIARLDTGSMYRAVTWVALERGADLDDANALASLAAGLDIGFTSGGISVDGVVREAEIRTPHVTASVSMVSRHRAVRRVLVALQQRLAETTDAVIEGRDIGSVVAPWAAVKVFLTASPRERARRRREDLAAAGHRVDLDALEAEIRARDARDDVTTPLRPAEGALVIDSTGRDIDEVVDEIVAAARRVRS